MPKPAAMFGAFHVCPQVTVLVPHVGGPAMGTAATVILPMPTVVMGDTAICIGPADSVIATSATVLVCGKPIGRMGDPTAHGGTIVMGMPTILAGS